MASYVQQHSAFVCSQIDSAIGHGSGCEAPTTLDDLDGAMMQVQSQLQSIVPSSSVLKPKPWQDETLRGTLSTAWRHLRQARAETGNGLRSLFNAWRHAHQFLKLITSTRKHCRRLRRARLLSFLDEAQEQANMHNIHGVFKVINKLAPRNLQRPQIRHTDGTLMDAEQESQATAAYLQEVYQDNSRPSFPTDLQAAGVPFTCEELRESISAIPARKAGPRHLACNVFYKHSAASVAPILYGFLQQWWDGGIPYVPQPFKDAWLTMLRKPGRVWTFDRSDYHIRWERVYYECSEAKFCLTPTHLWTMFHNGGSCQEERSQTHSHVHSNTVLQFASNAKHKPLA